MANFGVVLTAVGVLGWLLILREGLQRWAMHNRLKSSSVDDKFQISVCSKPLGEMRLIQLEWCDFMYCLVSNAQGTQIQVIDKHPIKKASS